MFRKNCITQAKGSQNVHWDRILENKWNLGQNFTTTGTSRVVLFAVWRSKINWRPHFYRPQRSWGKIMFLHVSLILFMEGGSAPLHAGIQPLGPEAGTPPDQAPLGPGTPQSRPHPLRTRGRHPSAQCMLGDTGNKRAVRILLECILVLGLGLHPV